MTKYLKIILPSAHSTDSFEYYVKIILACSRMLFNVRQINLIADSRDTKVSSK